MSASQPELLPETVPCEFVEAERVVQTGRLILRASNDFTYGQRQSQNETPTARFEGAPHPCHLPYEGRVEAQKETYMPSSRAQKVS
jgi:hypothetical protein